MTSPEQQDQVYDLDLDQEDLSDAERAIREAVDAVDARTGDGGPAVDEDDSQAQKPAADEVEEAGEVEVNVEDPEASAVIARLQADLAESRERALRSLADFENYRRRTEKRVAEEKRYAGEPVLRECLEVVDNLERALSAEAAAAELKSGVDMILKQLKDILERAGVKPVAAVGERFDPAVHEAVARAEQDDLEVATVLEQYQQGYLLHDRLLRASMVRVAVPAKQPASQPSAGEPEGDAE